MTFPFKDGDAVSIEDLEHWEKEQSDQRLREALRLAREGLTDWECLTDVMGRNERPDLLSLVWWRLPKDQLIIALADAWTGAEVPERRLPRLQWLQIFRAAGYHIDDTPATPPDSVVLWRGGTRKTRMAWTADRERAEWFQHRYEHLQGSKPGKLWTLTVGPGPLLAHYHAAARNEDEYVIDPTGLRPREVR
jgi:hypothetical protein